MTSMAEIIERVAQERFGEGVDTTELGRAVVRAQEALDAMKRSRPLASLLERAEWLTLSVERAARLHPGYNLGVAQAAIVACVAGELERTREEFQRAMDEIERVAAQPVAMPFIGGPTVVPPEPTAKLGIRDPLTGGLVPDPSPYLTYVPPDGKRRMTDLPPAIEQLSRKARTR